MTQMGLVIALLVVLGGIGYWLARQGRKGAELDQEKKDNAAARKALKDKNAYIRKLNKIDDEEEKLKKAASDAFRRGNVGDLVVVLDNAAKRKNTKAKGS